MNGDDVAYFQHRAEAEIELAQRADHADAVRVHYQLASAYLDRIHGEVPVTDPNPIQG